MIWMAQASVVVDADEDNNDIMIWGGGGARGSGTSVTSGEATVLQ